MDSQKTIKKLDKMQKVLVHEFKKPSSKTMRHKISIIEYLKKEGKGDPHNGLMQLIVEHECNKGNVKNNGDSPQINASMEGFNEWFDNILGNLFPKHYKEGLEGLRPFIYNYLKSNGEQMNFNLLKLGRNEKTLKEFNAEGKKK